MCDKVKNRKIKPRIPLRVHKSRLILRGKNGDLKYRAAGTRSALSKIKQDQDNPS